MKRISLLAVFCVFCAAFVYGEDRYLEIRAKRFAYTPSIIKVNKGDNVRIRLISEDVAHGLYIDGYEIETSAIPGMDGHLTFIADKSGKFMFRCSVTCGEFHPYMVGYLKVGFNWNLYAGAFLILLLGIGSLTAALKANENSHKKLFGVIPLSWRYELTKFKPVRALLKNRWFPFIFLLFNLFVFVIILIANFVGGYSTGNYNFGVMMVWILWWFLLMTFFVPLVGRSWCMICPFPIFGDWLQRGKLISVGRQKSWGLNKRWPNKWRNLWPLVILFFLATWFSGFFTVRPLAGGILLVLIIGGAIVISVIYGKRTFCLFVCPVSGFQGLYANFSACEVRVKNPEICKDHKPKTCVVGNEKGYGCPWMELPYDMNRNTYCGLCMECFKTCPYDNIALNVRPFGTDLVAERKHTDDRYKRRGLDEAFKALTMIGIFLVFFRAYQTPSAHFKDMIRGTTLKGFLTYLAEATVVDFLVIPIIFLLFVFLSKKASGNKEVSLKQVFVNFSYCLVPLGLAIWAAFSVNIILANGSYLLHVFSDPFAWGWNLFGTAKIPWSPFLTGMMPYLQALIILIGLAFALDYGFKFSHQTYANLKEAKKGWAPMLVFLLAVTIFCLWLFIG